MSSVLDFILKERIIAITVICSIVTFQFISTFKNFIVDPLLDFMLPDHLFDYLNVTIRDGIDMPKIDQKKLVIDFGQLLREFIKWTCVITILFILATYTRLPNIETGNPGVAIM